MNDDDGFAIRNRGLWRNAALGDLDGDGLLDIFMGQAGSSVLTPEGCPPFFRHATFCNNGDGTYTDVAGRPGLRGARFQ